mmetsp:Transcript_934/g.3933  ORF Transcript_934/g.3933 Transcript_934/m.3933 type:complete len:175 (-) Transcript_934:91-615(-)
MFATSRASLSAVVRASTTQKTQKIQTTTTTATADAASSIAPITARARAVLLDRVVELARSSAVERDDRGDGRGEGDDEREVREFTARCAMATTFFRRAHADPASAEAAHARVAVGYLDAARRRARRAGGGGAAPSRRVRRAETLNADIAASFDDVYAKSCAAMVGLHDRRGLIP